MVNLELTAVMTDSRYAPSSTLVLALAAAGEQHAGVAFQARQFRLASTPPGQVPHSPDAAPASGTTITKPNCRIGGNEGVRWVA